MGLHVTAEPQVEEAVEDQENLDSDLVHFDSQTPQHEPYSIENLSTLPEGATLPQIKDACVADNRKLSFSDDEIVIVEKQTRLQSKCADWYRFKKGAFLLQTAKELPVLNPPPLQLRL